MDQGPSPERSDEESPLTVFEMTERDPGQPSMHESAEPVLLFKPPEPNRLLKGARALLTSGGTLTRRMRTHPMSRGDGPGRTLPILDPTRNPVTGSATGAAGGAALALTVREGHAASFGEPTLEAGKRARGIGCFLEWIVAGICCAVWSVLGLVFWLPVLLGAMLHFSVAHVQAMLDGQVPMAAGAGLRAAASFYHRGFAAALDVARKSNGSATGPVLSTRSRAGGGNRGRLLRAAGWALATWYAALLVVGVVDWPHVELAGLVPSGALGDLPARLGEALATTLSELTHAAARISAEGGRGP